MLVLLRETGGIGDQICVGAVAHQLRHEGSEETLVIAAPSEYKVVAEHLRHVDGFFSLGKQAVIFPELRPRCAELDPVRYPYLGRLFAFTDPANIVDLNCPAFVYETTERGPLRFSRPELFCMAAGTRSLDHAFAEWSCKPSELKKAREWVEKHLGESSKQLVAFCPFATTKERSLSSEVYEKVLDYLASRFRVIFFNSHGSPGRQIPDVAYAIGPPSELVAALVQLCDFVFTVDTMFLHLAAALHKPTLAFFGPTDARATLRPYNLTESLEGSALCRHTGQDRPCSYNEQRGWVPTQCADSCRRLGCTRLQSLTAEVIKKGIEKWLA